MALFQKAPATEEDYARCKPLDIPPDQVLEMTEDEWYEKIYRGEDVPQLTIRAVLMGSVLGFFLAWTNLYVGLMTGWALGVAITACILSFTIWNGFLKIGIAKTPMSILENNCMQSTASSAGYSTGGTMVSAVTALLMLSATEENPLGVHLPLWVLVTWTICLAALGVVLAIPMKRNMINQERLRFPTGTAAAVTLQSLYSHGQEAVLKARALLVSGFVAMLLPIFRDIPMRKVVLESGETVKEPLISASSSIFNWMPAVGRDRQTGELFNMAAWDFKLSHNLMMIAAGALVGLRITLSMVIGALLLAYWIGPMALEAEWTNPRGEVVYAATTAGTAWKDIGVWIGAPILVASGLLAFLMQWKTIARSFSTFRGGSSPMDERMTKVEVPTSWFVWGLLLSGAGTVILCQYSFSIPWYYGSLAVLLTFVLSLVACRATGESDITPVGAMGKLMQLTYGALIPQNATANLMTAGITSGAAGSSADLLNDLKSGYLLGANPRRQFVAQALGILAGTLATVIGFRVLIPDLSVLMGFGEDGRYPAPSAVQWKAVADVFRNGIDSLHPMAQTGIWLGLAAGAVMVLAETWLPKFRKWLPSATGLGLGFIIPAEYPISMFIGALLAWLLAKASEKHNERYTVAIASGLIAGESIMAVIIAAIFT
ncbi:MAG: OPT family oligopeptide transporter [Planctomycetota bacterium]|nr:MAG: OPT family oligopeptide transporter [Planctomycetota bacterium]